MSLLRRSRKRSVFAKPRDCRRAWASPRTSPTCPTRRRCELPPHPDDRRQGEVGSVLLTQALSRCTRSTSGPPGIQQPRQRGSTSDSASRRWASARNSYSDPAARGIPPLRPTSRVVHIGDSDEPSGPVRSDRQNRIDVPPNTPGRAHNRALRHLYWYSGKSRSKFYPGGTYCAGVVKQMPLSQWPAFVPCLHAPAQ